MKTYVDMDISIFIFISHYPPTVDQTSLCYLWAERKYNCKYLNKPIDEINK